MLSVMVLTDYDTRLGRRSARSTAKRGEALVEAVGTVNPLASPRTPMGEHLRPWRPFMLLVGVGIAVVGLSVGQPGTIVAGIALVLVFLAGRHRE